MYEVPQTSRVQEVLLEQIRFGLQKRVSDSVILSLKMGTINPYEFVDRMSSEFIMDIQGFIWGEDLGEVIEKYPEDWWEAFKERWFTKKLLKKYPVKYKVFRARQKVAYPNLEMPQVKDELKIYFLQRS